MNFSEKHRRFWNLKTGITHAGAADLPPSDDPIEKVKSKDQLQSWWEENTQCMLNHWASSIPKGRPCEELFPASCPFPSGEIMLLHQAESSRDISTRSLKRIGGCRLPDTGSKPWKVTLPQVPVEQCSPGPLSNLTGLSSLSSPSVFSYNHIFWTNFNNCFSSISCGGADRLEMQ